MAKYLIMWESDMSRTPTDPKEQAELMGKQMELTKRAMDEGQITDWGLFASSGAGYAIGEGNAADALRGIMQFQPYIKFKVHPVLSYDEVVEIMKSLTG